MGVRRQALCFLQTDHPAHPDQTNCFLLFPSLPAVKTLTKEFIKQLRGTAVLRRN
jgi:hypothetical protein